MNESDVKNLIEEYFKYNQDNITGEKNPDTNSDQVNELLNSYRKKIASLQKQLLYAETSHGDDTKNKNTNSSSSLEKAVGSLHLFDLNRGVFEQLKGKYLDPNMMEMVNNIIIGDKNKVNDESLKTPIVGSSNWKIFKYPSDIDMMQIYRIKTPKSVNVLNLFILDLVKTMYELKNKSLTEQNIYFADSKIGFDVRFDNFIRSLGTLQKTTLNDSVDLIMLFEKTVPNYDQGETIRQLQLIQNFIKRDDYEKILVTLQAVTTGNMTGTIYGSIFDIIRKYYLLRWKIDEIIAQEKTVTNNDGSIHKISLIDCLTHNTKIKFDIWGKYNGRYTEITNLILLQWVNTSVNPPTEQFIGLQMENYDLSVAKDLEYYSHPDHRNCVKLTKRLWNRAIYHCRQNNIDPTQYYIIKIIYPLFNIDINVISQIKADIELLLTALKKRTELGLSYQHFIRHLFNQISDISYKIFKMVSLPSNKYDAIVTMTSNNLEAIFNLIKENIRTPIEKYDDITDEQFNALMSDPQIASKINEYLDTIDNELKKEQNNIYCKFVTDFNLDPRVTNSIVAINYTYNYLNLPAVNL